MSATVAARFAPENHHHDTRASGCWPSWSSYHMYAEPKTSRSANGTDASNSNEPVTGSSREIESRYSHAPSSPN